MPTTVANRTIMSLGRKEVTRSNAVWLAAFLFGASFTVNAAPGVETTAAANPQPGPVQTADLEYQEVNYSFVGYNVTIVNQSVPFPKEPAFGPDKIIRGTLQLGGASNSIAFAWNRTAGKLHLDLNRNLDLTDDPAGVFGCPEKNYSRNYQTFTNIHLSFKTPAGSRQVLADLEFWDYGSRPNCTAAMRSFWQGRLVLQGVEWQAGVVENPFDKAGFPEGSYLLLRPWTDRNKSFSISSGSLDAFPFPRKLFVQNHAWQLDCASESSGAGSKLGLKFTGQQPVLGELKITGDFIQRVILNSGPYLVVLDQPGPVVKVPTGRYNQPGVSLKKGDVEAYRETRYPQPEKWIVVDEKKPVVLAAGGPLKNSVSISRHGKSLRFNYQLLGAGGDVYQLARVDRSKPPEFAVYRGDRKIASGKFEFG
jgi:hypothetical protein